MNFRTMNLCSFRPKSAWIILVWNLRVVKEVEKRSMIDYRWMWRWILFYSMRASDMSVTTSSWTSLASTCSSQHYYAVVSKDHVYCIKIDSYIGSSTIIITTHRDVEIVQRPFSRIRLPTWGFCFGLHFDSCFFSPFRGKFTLLRLKTLRSHQSRFLRLTIVKYDSRDNIKMIFKLQVCSSLGVSVYCSGRTWNLIWAIPLFTEPAQNDFGGNQVYFYEGTSREWFRVLTRKCRNLMVHATRFL